MYQGSTSDRGLGCSSGASHRTVCVHVTLYCGSSIGHCHVDPATLQGVVCDELLSRSRSPRAPRTARRLVRIRETPLSDREYSRATLPESTAQAFRLDELPCHPPFAGHVVPCSPGSNKAVRGRPASMSSREPVDGLRPDSPAFLSEATSLDGAPSSLGRCP